MDGTLAQLIALALHGSVWLAEADRVEPPTLHGNSTFQHVGAVRFDGVTEACGDVASWLSYLSRDGASRIQVVMPDFADPPEDPSLPWHHRIGFVGGLPIGLLVQTQRGSELWRAGWEVGDRTSATPWLVTYSGEPTAMWAYCPPFGATWLELRSAVEEAAAFAGAHGMNPWGCVFAEALAQGVAERPLLAYPDMVPDHGVSLERRRLLALATRANVFGGMGSWNDAGFDDEAVRAEYEGISRRLFTSSMYALAAAVNVESDR
ncbi:hypothetical protein F4553_003260 [Allocatelliglobosispora scoriae]|uniref:Uncharacterized protein n=1 Tax=Allocatelliglobosispora scoriae TaxID=643052 RepID=A0A841BSU8_9ACTN|nr:hypothetical protein [Allocatelliglobosispora scoriae]MBB5869881.1 hypothetical protein [Allocatelliglobosispora scoriae]